MSEICSEFYKTNPKITVTLDIGNIGSSHVLWEKLDNNEIDILNYNKKTEWLIQSVFLLFIPFLNEQPRNPLKNVHHLIL